MLKVLKRSFSKKDLRRCYDDHFDELCNFLYYKCGDLQLAEDLVQEVYIKLWEIRDEIDRKKVKGLLFTMAKNSLMNHFNHLKVVRDHEHSEEQLSRYEKVTPEFILEEHEFKVVFEQVIAEMPDGSREVFLMNRIDGLAYAEIAARLELSVKAVEKRMSKALAIIKDKIGKKV